MQEIDYAYLETTSYCNLECSFCNRDEVVKTPRHMSLPEFKIILNKLARNPIKEIKLMGMGEPFLHPRFSEICQMTRETFPNARIISSTNCQFKLNGNVKRALRHLDLLYLSIDGFRENYEKFRKPSKWHKLISFLKDLASIDKFNCKLAINYTINPENVYDIPRVESLIERFSLNELRLNFVQNWTEEESASNLVLGFSADQLSFIKSEYSHLIKGKSNWDFSDCFWVKSGVYITTTGDMKVCCMNTSAKPIGNVILHPSINDLRKNPKYTEIANGCKLNLPTKHCENCSYKELPNILKHVI